MATKISLEGGKGRAVWDDRWRTVYEAIGTLQVERATDIEFDNDTGQWRATHRDSGAVLAVGCNRSEVIEQEVAWLETQWLSATI